MPREKSEQEFRIRRIHIAVSEAEYQKIKEDAENEGLSVSSYIRMILIYRGDRRLIRRRET